jgi:prephenate dehydratase
VRSTARAAFQGERGAFSEEAAVRLLGDGIEVVPCATFDALYRALDADRADLLLAPVENSLIGTIQRSQDLLLDSGLSIVGEVVLPVVHCLIGCPGASLENIASVQSHPAALAQCEGFFAARPHIRRITADDTAGSVAEVVALGDPTRAAIASRRAAEHHGGAVLLEHLEDHRENFTRFLLLGREPIDPSAGDKVSLVMMVRHEPGSLVRALEPFARRGVDLLKIESRPVAGRPWEYRFHLDLQGSLTEPALAAALEELRGAAQEVRVLGCYPSASGAAMLGASLSSAALEPLR